jgi:hypothetical protein
MCSPGPSALERVLQVTAALSLLILLTWDLTMAEGAGMTYQGAVYAMITAAQSVTILTSGLAASLLGPLPSIPLLITTGALQAMCSPGPSVLERVLRVPAALSLLILLTWDLTMAEGAGMTYQGAVYAMITAAQSVTILTSGLAASLLGPLPSILLLITTGALQAMCSPGPSALERVRFLIQVVQDQIKRYQKLPCITVTCQCLFYSDLLLLWDHSEQSKTKSYQKVWITCPVNAVSTSLLHKRLTLVFM